MAAHNTSDTYRHKRRQKILNCLSDEVALFLSAPRVSFPYRQNADFFYLSGIEEPFAALVLYRKEKLAQSILYIRERNPGEERWEGPRLGIKGARRAISVDDVKPIDNLPNDLPGLLHGARTLFFSPRIRADLDSLVQASFAGEAALRKHFPLSLKDPRLLTSKMRLIKDASEIRSIRRAERITAQAFSELAGRLSTLQSERHAARVLESLFAELGGEDAAFETIVAAGKNATCLHHRPGAKALRRGELVLIDAGVRVDGYPSDITRTLPVSGKFTGPQADVYDAVHRALKSTVLQVRPGTTLDALHRTCVRELTRGLRDLGVLRGEIADLVRREKYKPYFMHRVGHFLGLDVHDVPPFSREGEFLSSTRLPIVPDHVFTIEPGLYFDAQDKQIPKPLRGIGVRIEENILVTKNGHEVLSRSLPTARDELAALF